MDKQKYILAGLAVATMGTLAVTQIASAHGFGFGQSSDDDNENSLASKIASTYSLNQDDVQNTIESYHQEQQDARLQERVDAGDLTTEQKDLLEAKMTENRTKMDEIRNITDESQREDAEDNLRKEMRTWAEENNIPRPEVRGHGEGRMGMGMHRDS